MLDSMEKQNDIFFQTFVRNRVLNSESLDEESDVSFSNYQEHSLHGFLEWHFGRVLKELQLEQHCHDKHLT